MKINVLKLIEEVVSQTVLYHATNADFDNFSLNFIRNDNSNNHYGVFFCDNLNDLAEYTSKSTDGYLYTVEGNSLSLLDESDAPDMLDMCMDIHIELYGQDNDLYETWDDGLMGDINWHLIPNDVKDEMISRLIKSSSDGIYYPPYRDYGEDFPGVYCIWNLQKLKIVNKQNISDIK
jgi:hypothetical protein